MAENQMNDVVDSDSSEEKQSNRDLGGGGSEFFEKAGGRRSTTTYFSWSRTFKRSRDPTSNLHARVKRKKFSNPSQKRARQGLLPQYLQSAIGKKRKIMHDFVKNGITDTYQDWEDVQERLMSTRRAVHWKRGIASLRKSKKPFFFSPAKTSKPKVAKTVDDSVRKELFCPIPESSSTVEEKVNKDPVEVLKESIGKLNIEEKPKEVPEKIDDLKAVKVVKVDDTKPLVVAKKGEELFAKLHALDEEYEALEEQESTIYKQDYFQKGVWDVEGMISDMEIVSEELEERQKLKGVKKGVENIENRENNPPSS